MNRRQTCGTMASCEQCPFKPDPGMGYYGENIVNHGLGVVAEQMRFVPNSIDDETLAGRVQIATGLIEVSQERLDSIRFAAQRLGQGICYQELEVK